MSEEVEVTCPFCGEPTVVVVDLYICHQNYIEDCTVCCRPIDIQVFCENGALTSVEVSDGR
jgi:hypothetical protein